MKQDKYNKLIECIDSAFHSCDLSIEEMKHVFDIVRDTYALDMVFAAANQKYKYQLDHLITSCRNTAALKINDHIMLTEEDYHNMLEMYRKHPVCEEAIPVLKEGYEGSILHCAIMYGGTYYGTIGFRNMKYREWSDEEKALITELGRLLLIYIGLFNLGKNHDTNDLQEKSCSGNTISEFYLNLITGKVHTIKPYPPIQKWIKEWDDYSILMDVFTDKFIDPVYGEQLRSRFSSEQLKEYLGKDVQSVSMEYPYFEDGKAAWLRYRVELLSCDENGMPEQALIILDDITEASQKDAYYMHLSDERIKKYTVIAGIDLDTKQYGIYVDNRDEHILTATKAAKGNYQLLVREMAEHIISPEYTERYMTLFSLENIKKHFQHHSASISFDFPCMVSDIKFWVRMEAVKTQKYSEHDNKIMLYFSDITDLKNKEMKLEELKKSLEYEQQRVLEKEIQMMLDPLTGAYNRNGYDKVIESYQDIHEPIGFLMIDVDDFKIINDTYGHEFGDNVLCQVVKQLKAVFRCEDRVFRLGGDEFVLLLFGCKEDAWDSVRDKFAVIHRNLKKAEKNNIKISLSAGMTISRHGYYEEMTALADEALYHTKRTGKAGLSQINSRHEIINVWKDTGLAETQLNQPTIGNWRLEYTNETQTAPKLFFNEASRVMLEIPGNLDPEECFTRFYGNIPYDQVDLVYEMADKAVVTGQVECTFHWKHPTRGKILLRCSARYTEKGSLKEMNGYLQSLTDTNVILNYDDGQFLVQAMNSIYYCSYYINIHSKEYYIVKGHDDPPKDNIEITFCEFINTCVHPDYRELVREFTDLSTLPERLKNVTHADCEYLSLMKYGWCRSRFLPVKWNENGNVTHVLLVSASIDIYKKNELEKERQFKEAMKLQLHIGEIVSKSTVMQVGLMDKITGDLRVWHHSEFGEENKIYKFQNMKLLGMKNVCEQDTARFEEEFDLAFITRKTEENGMHSLTIRITDITGKIRTIILHYETYQADEGQFLVVVEDISDVIPKGIEWMRQFDILESINEAMVIIDYDTYDVVYMNKVGRELVNMDMTMLKTKKCYELFGSQSKPCPFCDKALPGKDKNGFTIQEVKGKNQNYFMHGSTMRLEGKKYRVEQAFPAAKIDASVDYLQGMLASEQKLMDCVQNLILITDVQKALVYLLDQIIQHYECDRACLVKVSDNETQGTVMTECCHSELEHKFHQGDVIPLIDFVKWEEVGSQLILLRRYFFEGVDSAERSWLQMSGLDNLMILSFEYGNGKVGFISIDNVKKNKDDSNWIGTLAFFIANEMEKITLT